MIFVDTKDTQKFMVNVTKQWYNVMWDRDYLVAEFICNGLYNTQVSFFFFLK